MAEMVTVASRLPMAVQIQEPVPEEFKEKPGDAPPLSSITLNGANHAQAIGGAGHTEVDGEVLQKWMEANKNHPWVKGKLISKVEGDIKEPSALFGFEPGLKLAEGDSENTKAAEKGSSVKEEGPVSSLDMKTTTDIPKGMETVPADQIPQTALPGAGPGPHDDAPTVTEGSTPILPDPEKA